MLELGDAELQLLPLVAGDEPELAEEPGEALARPFRQANAVTAPAAEKLLDRTARFVALETAALRVLVREPVCVIRRQRDGAETGEQDLLEEPAAVRAGRVTGLVHAASSAVAGDAARVSRHAPPGRPCRALQAR